MLSGHSASISYEPWPQFDEALCVQDSVTVAIQVNGKVRTKMEIPVETPEIGMLAILNNS